MFGKHQPSFLGRPIEMTDSDVLRASSQHRRRSSLSDEAQDGENGQQNGFRNYVRIFAYTDRLGWVLNVVAVIAAVGAGSALPLLDLLMGKMITSFNDFGTGHQTAEAFRAQIRQLALVTILHQECLLTVVAGSTWSICLRLSSPWSTSGR